MSIEIIVKCHSCQGFNKHNSGLELKQTEFNTFSDAHQHMIENPNHWMDFIARDSNENEDE